MFIGYDFDMGDVLEVRSTLVFPSEENQLSFSLRSSLILREAVPAQAS